MAIPLRLLMIEDSEDDAFLLVRELERGGYDLTFERVQTAADLHAALDRHDWDVITCDHRMPQFTGTQALALVRELQLDVPFIFVSGTIGEDAAIAAMKAGASDYVMKGNLKRLIPAIQRELREAEARKAAREAEVTLLDSEERLRAVLASALDAVVTISATGVVTGWSAPAETMFGWSRTEVLGRTLSELVIPPRYRNAHARGLAHFHATGEGPILQQRIEINALHRDGHEFPVEVSVTPFRLAGTWEFSAFVRDLTTRKHTEAALRESETSYATLVEHAPVGIYRSTPGGRFLSVNPALVHILGFDTADQVLQLNMARDVYADPAERQRLLARDFADREYDDVEATWKRRDGRPLMVQLTTRAVRNAAHEIEHYDTFVRDVTEQRQLEAQLALSQKLEGIGRLAGGVAHDFNNMLTVIQSYCDLILEDLDPAAPLREDIGQIRQAATASSNLTRQLLAFSRKQVLEPKVINLNTIVANTEKLLTRAIGEDIHLVTRLAPDLGLVKVDPGQIEQVIMNLAVNARDAMPAGGRLTIETANAEIDEDYLRGHGVALPGRYVMLAVSDTGIGMDARTQARIFEPFFTTKEPGKGTGLGLATVYGIVKQSGGFVWVYSEPGYGTSFKTYLPLAEAAVEEAVVATPTLRAPRGTETVLVAEDMPTVRSVTRNMLERQGYTVLEAPDGEAALRLAAEYPGAIDLLLTDVVMPRSGGRQLADRLVQVRPDVRVLYMSGYADDAIVHHGILEAGIAYLQKPFTLETLARKVRDTLDRR
jgi:two-component system cell cycle sensor histidine kinase/response regulator CckA